MKRKRNSTNNTISHDLVRALFTYDGVNLINRTNRGRAKAGAIAGSVNQSTGYRTVKVGNTCYVVARLVHFYTHGSWLSEDINRVVNRHSVWHNNLRTSTRSQALYAGKINRRNTTGVKGVTCRVGKTGVYYVARAGAQCRIHLGTYDTLAAATNARLAWENLDHPEFIMGKYPNGLPATKGTKVDEYINRNFS